MYKLLFAFGLCFALVTACATDTNAPTRALDLPRDVQMNADAITARQTFDAAAYAAQQAQAQANQAKARAEQYAAQQTAIAQSTHDAAAYAQTRVALDLQIASVTRQAAFDRATATEQARQINIANAETVQARQETRAAIQTSTRQSEMIAAQSAEQTRTSAIPTQTRQAEIIAQEQADRQREEQAKIAQAEWDAQTKPVLNFIWWSLLPLVLVCGIVAILFLGFWKLFRAFENYIRAKALEVSAPALAQMQIRDAAGRPIGYLQVDNGSATFRPYFETPALAPPETPVLPTVVMRDMIDQQAIETAPPDPQILNGFIHYTSLRAFIKSILESGDWTQTMWADKELPRGFVLSKDTKDERGNVVHGGYSRVMELLVQNNLIVNRRRGTAGQWNPHAPREIDEIMAILYHEKPRPPLPESSSPSPIASRPNLRAA